MKCMSVHRPFRFALQPLSAHVDILQNRDALASTAVEAESLGYEELYVPDHFGSVDPFIPLMVAAEATSTLRVGTLVLNNEFHHPALLARSAASIDRLTGGRFVLGCGTGYMQSEHDAIGIELRPPASRVDRFAESVAALRSLLDTGACSVSGDHVSLAVESLGVKPLQARIPFLIGGHGRRVVGIAGHYADIYQFTGLTHGAGGVPGPGGFAYADVALRAEWLASAAGERADDIERSTLVQHAKITSDSAAEVAAIASRFDMSETLVEETPFILIGSTAQIVDKLSRLRESLGISHVVVRNAQDFGPVVEALRAK